MTKYPNTILLTQANAGVSAARNRGIQAATGQWITLLDSDDEWLPDKTAQQLDALKASPRKMVCHSEEIWIRNGIRVNPMNKHRKPNGWIYQQCLPLCCVSPSAVMIHASLFIEVGLFDESLPACEDYDMWLRLFSRYPIKLVEQPLLTKYGGHGDQLSRQFWGLDRFRVKALLKILETGQLCQHEKNSTIITLHQKTDILIQGARKRGRGDIGEYEKIKLRWPLPEKHSLGA